jgi:hypothetical protein
MSSSGVLQIHDALLRVETCSVDFKSINKIFVVLMAEHVKGFNILLVVIHATVANDKKVRKLTLISFIFIFL